MFAGCTGVAQQILGPPQPDGACCGSLRNLLPAARLFCRLQLLLAAIRLRRQLLRGMWQAVFRQTLSGLLQLLLLLCRRRGCSVLPHRHDTRHSGVALPVRRYSQRRRAGGALLDADCRRSSGMRLLYTTTAGSLQSTGGCSVARSRRRCCWSAARRCWPAAAARKHSAADEAARGQRVPEGPWRPLEGTRSSHSAAAAVAELSKGGATADGAAPAGGGGPEGWTKRFHMCSGDASCLMQWPQRGRHTRHIKQKRHCPYLEGLGDVPFCRLCIGGGVHNAAICAERGVSAKKAARSASETSPVVFRPWRPSRAAGKPGGGVRRLDPRDLRAAAELASTGVPGRRVARMLCAVLAVCILQLNCSLCTTGGKLLARAEAVPLPLAICADEQSANAFNSNSIMLLEGMI